MKLRCTGTLYDPKSVTVMRAIIGVLEVVEEHSRQAEEAWSAKHTRYIYIYIQRLLA